MTDKSGADSAVDEAPTTPSTTPTEPASPKPDAAARSSGSIFDFDGNDEDDAPSGGDPAPVKPDGDTPTDKAGEEKPADATDWRAKIAKGDQKVMSILQRYASEDAWDKAAIELRRKMSSGEYMRKPGDKATEEEKAAWREATQVPAEWGDYELPEIEGYEWTEDDAPIVQSFLQDMHAADTPQPVAQKALEWYGKFVQQQQDAIHDMNAELKQKVDDTLRDEWGQDYRANMNLMQRYLKEEVDPEVFNLLYNAALPDGRRLSNSIEFVRWMGDLARGAADAGGMLYGTARTDVSNRVQEIENILKSDPSRYWREGLDNELLDLRRRLEGGKK